MEITNRFSDIATKMRGSEIRELLKYADKPDLISFGGGYPNPESFPLAVLKQIFLDLLQTHGSKIFQYGSTEGLAELREELSKKLARDYNIKAPKENILISTGSQQGLYMMGKILINPEDLIITEAPTYLAALAAFRASYAKIKGIDMDENGLRTDILEETLKKSEVMPKLVYVIPTFQNPAGITMSLDRRKHLVEIASKYDLLILEDDPYGHLRFSGPSLPPVAELDKEGRTIYLGTFSKILAPGLRIGYIAGNNEIIKKLNLTKQVTDLCASTLSQYIAYEYLKNGYINDQIPKIIEMYRMKRDLMINTLEEIAPKGIEWTKPDGGMFLWLKTFSHIDTEKMLPNALKNGVAYVIGSAFYPDRNVKNDMRLNFTYPSDANIVEGIKRLIKTIKEEV
jgi:2-aminoadipate transaminase